MAKRLQVILQDIEYREIQRGYRSPNGRGRRWRMLGGEKQWEMWRKS